MRPRELGSHKLTLPVVLTIVTFIGLEGCGTSNSRAIDVLRATNTSNEAQLAAVRQLQAGGKQALLQAKPELIQMLGSSAPEVQRAAQEALTLVGTEAAGDLVKLSADLRRRPSVLRILRQTSADNAVIEQVAASTRSGDYTERLHATALLGALSVRNSLALTQLRQLMSDQDSLLRIAAISEATDLELSSRVTLIPALIGALDDQILAVREAACIGLGNMGSSAIEAKSALERLTRERNSRLAKLAQVALADITQTNPDRPIR